MDHAGIVMTTGISRQLVTDYFAACVARDAARLAQVLDDNVQWSCAGPVDLIHFCGLRQGKAAVIDAIVRIAPTLLRLTGMELKEVLIDGNRAATFSRLTAIHADTGRTVSYRCAQFLRFDEGKLVEFRALMDSFDAAEQVLGHAIDTSATDRLAAFATRSNFIAL